MEHLVTSAMRSCLGLLAIVVCTCGTPNAVRAEEESTSKAVSDTTVTRSPRAAMIRSLVLPGWGQFYNGRPIKGSLIAALEVGSAVAFVARRDQLKQDAVPTRNVFLFSTIGIVLLSMADAYVDAHLDGVEWGTMEIDKDERGFRVMSVVRVHF